MTTADQRTIRGIIFDLDGVIADTAEFHYRAWKQIMTELGLPFSRQDNEALRGLTRPASLAHLLGGRSLPPAEEQRLLERKNRYFFEHMEQMKPGDALPGVEPLLDEARAAGLRLGVGSASRNAVLILEQLGLLARFDVVGDGTTVVNSKPAPDVFLWVAGALRLKPRELLVIEDAPVGVEAALHGGFYVVGVGGAQVGQAHAVRPSLRGVTLQDLLQELPA